MCVCACMRVCMCVIKLLHSTQPYEYAVLHCTGLSGVCVCRGRGGGGGGGGGGLYTTVYVCGTCVHV